MIDISDSTTGDLASNVDYVWELRQRRGELMTAVQLADGDVSYQGGKLILDKVKRQPGTAEGSCVVVDKTTGEKFRSKSFMFAIPPSYEHFGPTDVYRPDPKEASGSVHKGFQKKCQKS